MNAGRQRRSNLSSFVTLVAGLPRSGTSMMMRMLESGGLPVLTDHIRTADRDNPEGYYEYERVKRIEDDQDWLEEARGRAVKMVSALLPHLPASYSYKVIFMRRTMPEILASQRKMLVRRGEPADAVDDAQMTRLFEQHLAKVTAWLADQPNIQVLYVSYNDVLADPDKAARQVVRFLGEALDVSAMAAVVDPSLYRNRVARDGLPR
jgi:hypothetical protein